MTYKELKTFGDEIIKKNPHHTNEVQGLLELCLDEIQEGFSEDHEIELCWNDLNDLMNKKN